MIKKIISKFVSIILFSSLVFSCPAFADPRPFIIDTDMAMDDAMAILYLTQDKDVHVKAISVTGAGEAHCASGMRNLAGLLSLVKQNIPYACGRENPLQNARHFPQRFRTEADDLSGTSHLFKTQTASTHTPALRLLQRTLSNSDEPVDILAIGPLTNIAELIGLYPELKHKIHMIYIMGGAIRVAGNISPRDVSNPVNHIAEWNIYVDPLAANIVFASGIPVTIVPLDVTNQAPMDNDFFQRLEKKHTSAAANYIYQTMAHNKSHFINRLYFWDPLAAVVAGNPSLVKTQQEKIRVLQKPERVAGATVIDDLQGYPITVCTKVDKEKFKTLFLKTLNA